VDANLTTWCTGDIQRFTVARRFENHVCTRTHMQQFSLYNIRRVAFAHKDRVFYTVLK